jgi:hypothetical protein
MFIQMVSTCEILRIVCGGGRKTWPVQAVPNESSLVLVTADMTVQARQSTVPHRNAALNPVARITGDKSIVARTVIVLSITKTAIVPNRAIPRASPMLRRVIIMLDATPLLPPPLLVPRIRLKLGGKKIPDDR